MFPKMVLGPAAIVHGSAEGWRWLFVAQFGVLHETQVLRSAQDDIAQK